MGFSSRLWGLVPRPKSFLYLMSLRTGTELITLTLLLNKISGIYGLLALFTGFHLSTIQFSMYIYSLLALILTAFLAPHIRKESPLQCLVLAWFYVIDSIVNAAYTAAFAATWFVVVSQHQFNAGGSTAPGSSTMDDTAGFTSPKYNVSHVDVIATPASGLSSGQDAVAVGQGQGSASLGDGVLQAESGTSIFFILVMWAARTYFILVVMSFARSVIRQEALATSRSDPSTGSPSNPFAPGSQAGAGWRGKLGRALIKIGESYWLGGDEDDAWARGMDGRFRKSGVTLSGPFERERRRRSGTGPPPVPSQGIPLRPSTKAQDIV